MLLSMPDPVDRIVAQWGTVHPDLDTAPMAIMGRVPKGSLPSPHGSVGRAVLR